MPKVREKLFEEDPYIGFDIAPHPADTQGWGSTHDFFEKIISSIRPSTIIEVGSWKGASAIYMASICKRLQLDTEIVCVDTWLGSQEHIVNRTNGYYDSLRVKHGFPNLYFTFLANVVRAGMQEMITPFPIASESAAVVLKKMDVKAELVYIDAAHEYEPALRDMKMFWSFLTAGGIMICDDYGYSDVTQAACEFAAAVKKPLYAPYGKAFIPNSRRHVMLTLDKLDELAPR